MRVLVTGGAGFIGSHLAEELFRRGDEVVVLDNLATGLRSNLRHLENRVGFEFVEGSTLDGSLVDSLVKNTDAVVHLAAEPRVSNIMNHPYSTLVTNVKGTENVLTAAVEWGRRTVIASTSEVYGKNEDVHLSEDSERVLSSTEVVRWSYSTGKALDETLTMAAYLERGVPATVMRFFNTVGPRQSLAYGTVVPTLVQQALTGKTLTVHGDGQQVRTFSYVADAVDAILAVLARPHTAGEIFNIGSDEAISIIDLAQAILDITQSPSPIAVVPYEAAYGSDFEDSYRRVPDISKARSLLGFSPRWSLDDILRAMIADQKSIPIREPLGQMRPPKVFPDVKDLGPAKARISQSEMGPLEPAVRVGREPRVQPRISVIVPIYNEAPSATEMVRRLRNQPEVDQLVVVNDGSTDNTRAELEKVRELIDELVDLPKNKGKGAALRAGIEVTDGDIVVFQDADLELDCADVPVLLQPILTGQADVVFGSRIHEGNKAFVSPVQWQGNLKLSAFTRKLYGLQITDVATGSRAFRRDTLIGMELISDGFTIEPEITAKAARMGLRVSEVPIVFRPRRRSDGKKISWWGSGMEAAGTLIKYRFWRPDYRKFSHDPSKQQGAVTSPAPAKMVADEATTPPRPPTPLPSTPPTTPYADQSSSPVSGPAAGRPLSAVRPVLQLPAPTRQQPAVRERSGQDEAASLDQERIDAALVARKKRGIAAEAESSTPSGGDMPPPRPGVSKRISGYDTVPSDTIYRKDHC